MPASKALAYGPVGRLPEIAALGVLDMGPAGQTSVIFISVISEPVSTPRCFFSSRWVRISRCQFRSSTSSLQTAIEAQAAAPLRRFQEKMHLGVMAQRLEMAYALHRFQNRLLVDNVSVAKLHIQPEAVPNQTFQDLDLHLSHNLGMNLAESFIPDNVKLRDLLLQLEKL